MMKRNLCLILALSLVGVLQVSAQQIVVHTDGGSETKLEESDFESCKITFADGKMLFHVGGTVKQEFSIKEIQRISFYGLPSAISSVEGEDAIVYAPATGVLTVNVQPGTSVSVYHADGARALSYMQTIASTAISVAHLPSGVYVVVAGSETLKFMKR